MWMVAWMRSAMNLSWAVVTQAKAAETADWAALYYDSREGL